MDKQKNHKKTPAYQKTGGNAILQPVLHERGVIQHVGGRQRRHTAIDRILLDKDHEVPIVHLHQAPNQQHHGAAKGPRTGTHTSSH